MHTLIFISAMLMSFSSLAYIPPVRMILERVSDNAGNGIYVIEQEVQMSAGLDPIYLRETWTVENDRTFRLNVTGTKELRDSVQLQFVYVNGQKWQLKEGNRRESFRISEEFAERFFHIRNYENFIGYLQILNILPRPLPQRKAPAKDGKFDIESYLRLSRTDGAITYALGQPTPADTKDRLPGVWIEQDQFVVRKIRFPSQAEVVAENYAVFTRGLNFPKLRTIQWGPNTVYLRVLSVTGKNSAEPFQASSLDTPRSIKNLPSAAIQSLIEEFYTRFR
jgi:hypothetical protein